MWFSLLFSFVISGLFLMSAAVLSLLKQRWEGFRCFQPVPRHSATEEMGVRGGIWCSASSSWKLCSPFQPFTPCRNTKFLSSPLPERPQLGLSMLSLHSIPGHCPVKKPWGAADCATLRICLQQHFSGHSWHSWHLPCPAEGTSYCFWDGGKRGTLITIPFSAFTLYESCPISWEYLGSQSVKGHSLWQVG